MKRRLNQPARKKAAPPRPIAAHSAPFDLVQIEKPVYGGAFLARVEGKALFVPLALPGEQVRVRIAENKRGYATAEAEEIVTSAPQRVAPVCRHFGACGGCHYKHAGYAAQLQFKQAILRETLERAGVRAPQEIAVLSGEPWAYRNRIRVAFDGAGSPGYRGRRSHSVIPIAECPIAAPLLVRAAQGAAEILRQPPFGQMPTEVSLFCDAAETALLVSVFTRGAAKDAFQDFARALKERVPALRGAELVAAGSPGQPPRAISQWGATFLTCRAAGFDFRVDHGAFFQINRWLVDALVESVTAGRSGALAWDLFAGVGLFARRLAEGFARVVAVESAPAAAAALEQNLSGTGSTAVTATTLEFLRRNRPPRRAERPDLIVADPPRTGLGAEACKLLGEIAAPSLVYVSCDPATLARDLRALLGSGYVIQNLALADLFPHTFHIEAVAELRRLRLRAQNSRAGDPFS